MSNAASTYDEVRYPSIALPQTHPQRLATLASLFGLDPAPVDRCRVLEVGCGDGSNLIAMGWAHPESTFVGIDVAARTLEDGQAAANALGLRNVDLQARDLMALGPDVGLFDYIIAHGFYSWVPPAVRNRLLAVCQAHLAPHGVAYVSYNTLPGGHLRRMTREMMRFHIRGLEDPAQRAAQARAFLSWLRAGQADGSYYDVLLEKEEDLTRQYTDAHFYHDHLADVNDPVYFYQFAAHAAGYGLRYLAEADFTTTQSSSVPAGVGEVLRRLDGDPIMKEQYLDFLRCRMFRQTLLCRQEAAAAHTPQRDRVQGFFAAAPARELRQESGAPHPPGAPPPVTFESFRERTVRTAHPLAQAVFRHLGAQWPCYVSFDALQKAVADVQDAHLLDALLLDLYGDGFVALQRSAPRLARGAGERPEAPPFARWQAPAQPFVTSLLHEAVPLEDERLRRLLPLLDGTRTRAALLQDWAAAATADGRPAPTAEDLEDALGRLAHHALLVA